MRTGFTHDQLSSAGIAECEANLRACMHCGICTATCPTYVLLGDERDGPRGRIVMMQAMLEKGGAPTPETVLHVDRCLSCLSCRTACPSGVDYGRLVDVARAHIETHFRRPLRERFLRRLIAELMSRPSLVRASLQLARLFAPIATRMPGRIGAMARKGASLAQVREAQEFAAAGPGKPRVAILAGCVQSAVAPEIDQAMARLLVRDGLAPFRIDGCCGSLAHHLGRTSDARTLAMRMIAASERAGDVDAITISATGCCAHLKDYAHLFAGDPVWEKRARAFAMKVRDASEIISAPKHRASRRLRVAFHSACSAQHGLGLKSEVESLLTQAGFEVVGIAESHLCCGSAGSYSLLQPEISQALRARKLENIKATRPDIVATGNIGCLVQLAGTDAPPIVHYAELLDWADGGPVPGALQNATVDEREPAR